MVNQAIMKKARALNILNGFLDGLERIDNTSS
jgi:hypothetical protein